MLVPVAERASRFLGLGRRPGFPRGKDAGGSSHQHESGSRQRSVRSRRRRESLRLLDHLVALTDRCWRNGAYLHVWAVLQGSSAPRPRTADIPDPILWLGQLLQLPPHLGEEATVWLDRSAASFRAISDSHAQPSFPPFILYP